MGRPHPSDSWSVLFQELRREAATQANVRFGYLFRGAR
jgi:hypothetical protein